MEVLQACARSKDPRMIKLFQRVMEGDADQEVRTRAAEMFREAAAWWGDEQTAAVRSATHRRRARQAARDGPGARRLGRARHRRRAAVHPRGTG
jgi:hypothetical protein